MNESDEKKELESLREERQAICQAIGAHPGGPSLLSVIQGLYAYAQGWSVLRDEGIVDNDGSPLIAANRLIRRMGETRPLEPTPAMYRCTVCGRIGTVGRCCGLETREPLTT